MPEEWRPVKGFEELFLVSNTGRVKALGRSYNDNGTDVWLEEHIVQPFVTNIGYVQYNLRVQGKCFKRYAHRLVAEAFIPNPAHKQEVDHIDNDKTNNCVNNLQWVTHSENMKKMFEEQAEKHGYLYTKDGEELRRGSKYNLCSCGAKKSITSQVCITCRKAALRQHFPSKEELLICAREYSCVLSKMGKHYGITDDAIRRRLRNCGLPDKSSQLQAFVLTQQTTQ